MLIFYKMKNLLFVLGILLVFPNCISANDIPNLIGEWSGKNDTYSETKGMKSWKKTIKINKQKDRRFSGKFTYTDGSKEFYGVIHPDNKTITWVSSNSRGYNMGRIINEDKISACYVESGIDSTVGCAELTRK